MKIDMSPRSITLRLQTVNQLRQVCLSLAKSSAGQNIRKQFSTNKSVQRTSQALGH